MMPILDTADDLLRIGPGVLSENYRCVKEVVRTHCEDTGKSFHLIDLLGIRKLGDILTLDYTSVPHYFYVPIQVTHTYSAFVAITLSK